MGTSVALSFDAARRRHRPRLLLLTRILRRTALLFILGLVVSNHGLSTDLMYCNETGTETRLGFHKWITLLLCTASHSTHIRVQMWYSFVCVCMCVRACIVEDSELSLCGILVGFLFYVHFNRFLPRDAMHGPVSVCVCVSHKSEFY